MIDGVIVKGVGGAYTVAAGGGLYTCAARGVFRKQNVTPLVGDGVAVNVIDAEKMTGVIHDVLPRRNMLTRPRIANIDQALVTLAAARPDFNAGLLDRFLLLAEHAGVTPVICVNKWDLAADEGAYQLDAYESAGYTVLRVSAADGTGIDALRAVMAGKTSVFAGPSGAGKSSLINALTDTARETGGLSARINRGKHTTRHTELIPLVPSGFCADTPGFTSLDISHIPRAAYDALFREFGPFLGRCRFADCRHDKEGDCAVKAQVGQGIHPARYASYLRFLRTCVQ